MRNLVRLALLGAMTLAVPVQVHAQDVTPDFVLSLLRFGVECRRPAMPRQAYIGDAARFAVSIERAQPPSADGVAQPNERVTYRAFYKDLGEPEISDSSVVLRCRANAKCMAAYKKSGIERAGSIRLETCSARTATLVAGATRQFIRTGQ
ncbi:MAG: hypothetical protein JWN07_421 [Hyphomicrobiales bacterium]|nr:hypothetical protein [Hyphomicrobiales bacterium]